MFKNNSHGAIDFKWVQPFSGRFMGVVDGGATCFAINVVSQVDDTKYH